MIIKLVVLIMVLIIAVRTIKYFKEWNEYFTNNPDDF